jgi:hypothetical protein
MSIKLELHFSGNYLSGISFALTTKKTKRTLAQKKYNYQRGLRDSAQQVK